VIGSLPCARPLRRSQSAFEETPRLPRPDKLTLMAPGVWYVDLARVTDAEWVSAQPVLQAATGIVFDLRGYPRSVTWDKVFAPLINTRVESPLFLFPHFPNPDQRGATFETHRWAIEPGAPADRLSARLAFLSGHGSISRSEVYLAIAKAYNLGPIVGEATGGSNGEISYAYLPGGYRIGYTGMIVRDHAGGQHHGIGVLPAVPVTPTLEGIRLGRDEVLERALELVTRQDAP
jgi:hypothetical protein